jgi:hypothetical protein
VDDAGCQLALLLRLLVEHLPADFPCGLGFLKAWRLGSKSKFLRETTRISGSISRPALEVTQHHHLVHHAFTKAQAWGVTDSLQLLKVTCWRRNLSRMVFGEEDFGIWVVRFKWGHKCLVLIVRLPSPLYEDTAGRGYLKARKKALIRTWSCKPLTFTLQNLINKYLLHTLPSLWHFNMEAQAD